MAVTRIKNNQITDSTIVGSSKLTDYTITSAKLANNLTYNSDLTIAGNLTVSGNTTTIDTNITTIEDPVIVLASTQTGNPTVDIGFIGERGTSDNIAFVWDESADEFVTAFTSTSETNTTITISSYSNFHTNDANIGGNIVINGTSSLIGNVLGNLNVTGNIAGGNLLTPGLISATGNVTGGNLTTAGQVAATGNVSGGNLNTAGLVSAATATVTGNVTGGNLLTGGVVTATGNVSGGNLTTGGQVSATGNITGGNLITAGLVSAGTTITATGNVTGGNVTTGGVVTATGNVSGGNVTTGGQVVATGNVTGGNVTTGGQVVATGNVTGGNISAGSGIISTTGNVNGGNLNATTGVRAVTGYFTGNVDVLGNLNASIGVVYANSGIFYGNSVTGNNAAFAGVPGFTPLGSNVVMQFAGNVNSYSQLNFQNINNGNRASTDFIATADNGDDSSYYLDLGINSSTFDDPVSYPGFGPNDSYVHNHGGNLILNPETSGTAINFMIGGTDTTDVIGYINASGLSVTGTISATGNVSGGNLTTAGQVTATGNVTGGNLITSGLASVTGNVSGGNVTTAGQVTATGNVTGGNLITSGLVSAGTTVTATGNVSGGNVTTAGQVTSTGNVTGGNLITAGIVSATGNITGGNVTTPGLIAATGNISGGNISAGSGIISTTGNVNGGNINTSSIVGTTIVVTGTSVDFELSGNVSLSSRYINDLADPVQAQDAATKNYVDTVAQGLDPKASVYLATATALPAYTYNNGSSGVGATITLNAAGNLTIDGTVASANIRVLIKNETSTDAPYNGIYVVTTAGTPSVAAVLTRATDFDSGSPSGEIPNAFTFVEHGSTNADTGWVCTTNSPVTVGTTNITFTQFSGAGTYTAGNALSLTGTQFNVNTDGNIGINGSNELYIVTGATINNPNITAATGTSLSVTGNVSGGNITTGGQVVATGNVTGGNLITAGLASVTGNISGGNLTTTGTANIGTLAVTGNSTVAGTETVTGNITGGNLNTGGQVAATGNVTGGNVTTAGVVTATGNVSGGNITTAGQVTATGNVTGGNLITTGLASVTGNVSGGNITTVGQVVATGNITGGNLSGTLITGTLTTAAQPNVTSVGTLTSLTVIGNTTSGNLNTGGQVVATGNITGGNLITLGTLSSASISATGNITGGNLTTAGIANVGTLAVTGNSTVAGTETVTGNITGGNLNTGGQVVATGNVSGGNVTTTGQVAATGNITGGNLTTTGLISAGTTITATANVAGGNLTTAGQVAATGNVTGGNLITAGLASVTGNITGGNLITGGQVVATGNVNGGNVVATALVTGANVTASANVTGANVVGTTSVTGGNIVISGDNITDTNGRVNFNTAGADVDFAVNADTVANAFYVDAGTGTASFGSATQTTGAIVAFNSTNSILMPVGNVGTRPGSGVTGMLRFSTTENALEVYDNSQWSKVGVPSFTVIADDQFNGDGSTVAFTISQSSTSAATIVSINGVVQIPGTAYSVSGTTLTFTEAPLSGDLIDVRMLTTTTSVTEISNASGNAVVSVVETANTVQITGELLPASNAVQSLGSSTKAWKSLYVAGNTIYLGGLQLKEASANTFAVYTSDGTTQANIDVGNIDVSSITQGTSVIGISGTNGNAYITVAGTANVFVANATGANITGTLGVTGNITGGNLSGTSIVGTLTTAAQTNITSVGTLGSLTVTANVAGGNITTGGQVVATGNITGGNLSVGTGTISGGNIVNTNANGVGNIGSSTTYFNTVFAKATSALYADLAEKYVADAEYPAGTVVIFGGDKEVTVTSVDADRAVAGVVSTNPSYIMNGGLQAEFVATVALTGRVPCRVTGTVRKGDLMVSAGYGLARAEADPRVGTVIGKALENFEGNEGVIEVVVGRF